MKRAGFIAIVITTVLLSILVWPTSYRQFRDSKRLYREHRITGQLYRFTPSGWEPSGGPSRAGEEIERLRGEISQLEQENTQLKERIVELELREKSSWNFSEWKTEQEARGQSQQP